MALLSLLAAAFGSLARAEAPRPERQVAAERLVFVLQYIGADYPAAVHEGEVVNPLEYREMIDFAVSAEEQLATLDEELPPAGAETATRALQELRRLIDEKADVEKIRQRTGGVIAIVIESFGLKPVPRQIPRTDRAANLYRENCATCHGERGDGNGPEAAKLEPPPAAFTDRERMRSAAPHVFYNAITFGIEGTAMASFREAFDDQERWDLAFYLWRFVAREDLPDPADITVSLRDLATRSSEDLVAEVLRRGRAAGVEIDRDAASAWIASRRAYPRPVSDHEGRLAEVRRELVASLEMLDGNRLDAAAEQVTSAYLDHFEPLEPDIDRIDPSVRQRFERGLIDFRTALRRGDAKNARSVGGALLDTVAAAEDLFRAPAARGFSTLLVLGAVGVLLVGGMVVMTLRRG